MGIRLPWATGAAVALVLWIVLGVRGLAPVRAGTPDELKARFLKEAPTAWEEYQAYLQGLQGTLVSTGTLADGKLHGATRYEFRNNGNAKLRLVQCLGPEYWEGEVVAFNPVYGFTLKRRSPDAGWALSDLEMGEKGYNRKLWATGLLLPLTWSISPAGDNLAALVRKPTFRVIRASALRRGGIELVHIDFENRHPHAATPLDPTQGGSFLVDPERSYLVTAR